MRQECGSQFCSAQNTFEPALQFEVMKFIARTPTSRFILRSVVRWWFYLVVGAVSAQLLSAYWFWFGHSWGIWRSIMSRSKHLSHFPHTEYPACRDLTARDNEGVLVSEFARRISFALVQGEFQTATKLNAFETEPLKFMSYQIDQILSAIEDTMDRQAALDSRQNATELMAAVEKLAKAGSKFEASIKAFLQTPMGQSSADKRYRLAAVLGMDKEELRSLRKALKMPPDEMLELFIGPPMKIAPNELRDRCGLVLLKVYVAAGGVISKTKSPDGIAQNRAALFLMDVVGCLKTVPGVPPAILKFTPQSAERFVVDHADRITLKAK